MSDGFEAKGVFYIRRSPKGVLLAKDWMFFNWVCLKNGKFLNILANIDNDYYFCNFENKLQFDVNLEFKLNS